MSKSLKYLLWALPLGFLLIYILPLGVRPMVIPDEARYAEIPREMLESGNWIVPYLNGLRYFEKPVLGYWMNALSLSAFGETAFAIRLPSALAAGFSALLLFLLSLRFVGNRTVAALSAAIFLTCLEVFAVGVFSVLDSLFAFLVTASLVAFFFGIQSTGKAKHGYLALFGVACGLAFLTKGFLAFALPVIVIVPFMLWEGRWKELFTCGWLPMGTAFLTILPWAWAVHLQAPDYWHYFFWEEHIKRFSSSTKAQHLQPFWFFIPVLLLGALPWTSLVPQAVRGLWREGLNTPLLRYALCWLILPFLFFSISKGKLGTYILPCFAPLAILLSVGLWQHFSQHTEKRATWGDWLNIALAAVFCLALFIIQLFDFGVKAYTQSGEAWKWLLVLLSVGVWIVLTWSARNCTDPLQRLTRYIATPLAFMLSVHFAFPQQVEDSKAPDAFLRSVAAQISPQTLLVSDSSMVHAVAWAYKRKDIYMLSHGELEYGLKYPDSEQRFLDEGKFKQFVAENQGKRPIAIIYRGDQFFYKNLLPANVKRFEQGKFFVLLF
jgi:4-amino-4-deoxy-L-arabinose transferase